MGKGRGKKTLEKISHLKKREEKGKKRERRDWRGLSTSHILGRDEQELMTTYFIQIDFRLINIRNIYQKQ